MAISVSELKARCLEIVREVQRKREPLDITRRGEVVARLLPVIGTPSEMLRPWERLRGSGTLVASAGESVLDDSDFEAMG